MERFVADERCRYLRTFLCVILQYELFILTKSVSRFARNTVDSLSTVRKLKEKGSLYIYQLC